MALCQTGAVTGRTVGSAAITARCEGATGTVSVQVTIPPVTTVSVTPPSSTIYATGPSNAQQLTAATTPAGVAVTWSNGGSTIATVDEHGHVTATGTSAGSATITATSTNTAAAGSAIIAVIGHVRTVTLNVDNSMLSANDANTAVATASLIDTFGTNVSAQREVTWTSSDPTTITINNSADPVVANPATTPVALTTVSRNSASVRITATTDDGATGSVTIRVNH